MKYFTEQSAPNVVAAILIGTSQIKPKPENHDQIISSERQVVIDDAGTHP
jgi:hypothetical protein